MLAIAAPIDIQPASRTSPSSKDATDSHESLADSGYESSWPSLLEAAAWLPPSGQRRKGSFSSSDLGGADFSDSSDNLGLETGDNCHSSYTRYSKSTADEKNQKNTSGRQAKSQRRRARTQAYQAKRMSQSQGMPLVDIGSPNMDDDGHNHEIAPPIPIPLSSVMPRRWLFEEDFPLSLTDDVLISMPKREWVYDSNGPMSMDAKSFSVMSWNVLSPRLCHPLRLDAGCHPAYLEWSYRKQSILNQIAFMDADFVCLQELELKDYEEYFAPRLSRLGYRSIHAYKMNVYEMRDGCAIFYRESRFKLLHEHVLRFNQVELDDSNEKRPSMARDTAIRFNLFHNLALVALFENKRTRRCVQLATTHLLADPAFPDAKMLQTAILTSKLEELKTTVIAEQRHSSHNHNHNHQHQHHIPTILTGDFNSLPDSSVVDFLRTGKVETRQFGGNDFGRFTRTNSKYFHHNLGLSDSYKSSTLPFTNATRHFQGTIDYLLFDATSLGLVGFLDHFQAEHKQETMSETKDKKKPLEYSKLFHTPQASKSLNGVNKSRPQLPRALPSQHFPSDHIPLAAVFREHDYSVQYQQYLSGP
ncbi:Glucose-repressible alcohol dehydrogenase transcriptional effector [Podila epicladia]|nr:Glucose-repressible alcohol dehydrogenase transcriptional effector [Podila epicladia]